MRRLSSSVLAAALLAVLAASPALASVDDEVELIEQVNLSRVEAGLSPLDIDMGLIISGRGHSAAMATAGELFHSTRGQLASYAVEWELMGENVGRGPSGRAIHEAFMESDSHRANILGDFDAVGAGVERSTDGTLFVTVVFMRRSPDATDADASAGPITLISGLPEFAVSRLQAAAEIFHTSGRELCSPVGSSGPACID